jgi:hypothetical protein
MYTIRGKMLVELLRKASPSMGCEQMYSLFAEFSDKLSLGIVEAEHDQIYRLASDIANDMFKEGIQAKTLAVGYYEALMMGAMNGDTTFIEIKQGPSTLVIPLKINVLTSLHALILK